MSKKIWSNQQGMSLIEVTVASAISVVIAMGVMKINETSQKGFNSAVRKSEMLQIKGFTIAHLGSPAKCGVKNDIDTDTFASLYDTAVDSADFALDAGEPQPPGSEDTHRLKKFNANGQKIQIVTGNSAGDLDNNMDTGAILATDFIVNNGDTAEYIPIAPSWRLEQFVIYEAGATTNTCYLRLDFAKKGRTAKSFGAESVSQFIEIYCLTDPGTSHIESCNAISAGGTPATISDSDGDGVRDQPGPIAFLEDADGGNVVSVGDPSANTNTDAALYVKGNTPDLTGSGTAAIELEQDGVITFGNDAAVWGDSQGKVNSRNPIKANGGLEVGSASTFSDTVSVNAQLNANDNASFNKNAAFNSTSSFATTATFDGPAQFNDDVNIPLGASIGGKLDAWNITAASIWTHQDIVTLADVHANSYITTSDERFKERIETVRNASEDISNLRGVTYFMRRDEFPDRGFHKRKQIGLIAQEVEVIFPELVFTNPKTGYKGVNYISLVAVMIEAMKDQMEQIKKNKEMFDTMSYGYHMKSVEHDSRLQKLEDENKQLRLELNDIKTQVDELNKKVEKLLMIKEE